MEGNLMAKRTSFSDSQKFKVPVDEFLDFAENIKRNIRSTLRK